MSVKIKETPLSERPYEKLEMYGPKVLSNSELLAIIIKNGTRKENSIELAKRILSLKGENLNHDLRFLRRTINRRIYYN